MLYFDKEWEHLLKVDKFNSQYTTFYWTYFTEEYCYPTYHSSRCEGMIDHSLSANSKQKRLPQRNNRKRWRKQNVITLFVCLAILKMQSIQYSYLFPTAEEVILLSYWWTPTKPSKPFNMNIIRNSGKLKSNNNWSVSGFPSIVPKQKIVNFGNKAGKLFSFSLSKYMFLEPLDSMYSTNVEIIVPGR